jgi:hypothetical protein
MAQNRCSPFDSRLAALQNKLEKMFPSRQIKRESYADGINEGINTNIAQPCAASNATLYTAMWNRPVMSNKSQLTQTGVAVGKLFSRNFTSEIRS